MHYIKQFFKGLFLPLRAVKLILTTPKLLIWSAAPLTASILIYIVLWNQFIAPFHDSITIWSSNYLSGVLGADSVSALARWLQIIISWIVKVLLWVAMAITFSSVTNILALPLNDYLSKLTESYCGGDLEEKPFSLGHELRLLWIDLKKSLLSAFVLILCLSVAWVPIMNAFAAVAAWLMLTFQYVSYSQTRRSIGARDGLAFVFSNFCLSLGFGITVALGFGFPLTFIFMTPIAVVGGTVLFAETRAN